MSVSLKIVLGTVNYSDYLRVSAAKVSDPSTEVFVEYINTPVTNYTLVIPDLDPENYYIRFRDAPDTGSLGTLISEAFVNALTGEFEYERRFYTVGSLPEGVTLDATNKILTDPYLVNKTITGVFKEGFRYFEPDTEIDIDSDAGTIENLVGEFSTDEKIIIEIKYNTGSSSVTNIASLFAGVVAVTGASYSVLSTDKGKMHSLNCTGAVQALTLPLLSAVAEGDFFYFEHTEDGAQAQSKILTAGTDKVLYNGFDQSLGTNLLAELWVSKGQSLYIRKQSGNWKIIFGYEGVRVGERMASTWRNQPNWLPEDGRLLDGDEYPAPYWWIRNVLENTHYITDDNVVSGGYVHPDGKEGCFVIHSTLKKFRLPNNQNKFERGLSNFTSYGSDTERIYDYPGGKQNDEVGEHNHPMNFKQGKSDDNESGVSGEYLRKLGASGGSNYGNITINTGDAGGTETRGINTGVIYMRRIG